MATLLEKLRAGQQKQPIQTNQTQSIQQAMQGKLGASGPVTNLGLNLGAEVAKAETGAGLEQVNNQAAIQNAGIQAQETELANQERQGRAAADTQRQGNQLQKRIQTNQIFADLEANGKTMDSQRKQSLLEQVGQNIALEDKKYVTELQREGELARLNNDINFKQALQRDAFNNNEFLLNYQIGHKKLVDMNEREFKDTLARMNIFDAIKMLESDLEADRQRASWEGAGNIASAGVGAWAKYDKDKES